MWDLRKRPVLLDRRKREEVLQRWAPERGGGGNERDLAELQGGERILVIEGVLL